MSVTVCSQRGGGSCTVQFGLYCTHPRPPPPPARTCSNFFLMKHVRSASRQLAFCWNAFLLYLWNLLSGISELINLCDKVRYSLSFQSFHWSSLKKWGYLLRINCYIHLPRSFEKIVTLQKRLHYLPIPQDLI